MKPKKLLETLSPHCDRMTEIQCTIIRDNDDRMVEQVTFKYDGRHVLYEQHADRVLMEHSRMMPECPPFSETGLAGGNRGYWLDYCNRWNTTAQGSCLYVEPYRDVDSMDPYQGNLVLSAVLLIAPSDGSNTALNRVFVRTFLDDLDRLDREVASA